MNPVSTVSPFFSFFTCLQFFFFLSFFFVIGLQFGWLFPPFNPFSCFLCFQMDIRKFCGCLFIVLGCYIFFLFLLCMCMHNCYILLENFIGMNKVIYINFMLKCSLIFFCSALLMTLTLTIFHSQSYGQRHTLLFPIVRFHSYMSIDQNS